MVIIKRNQILIVSLVVMVIIAGLLNYLDRRDGENYLYEVQTNEMIPTEMIEVNENKSLENNDVPEISDDEIGMATLVDENESTFFLEAKINREQTREERKEWLMELINTVAVADDKKEDAMSEIISIQENMEKEKQAESLIESKGFGSTYVRVDEAGVDVVVDKQNLTQNEIAQIADIVERKTGITIEKIKISSLKKE